MTFFYIFGASIAKGPLRPDMHPERAEVLGFC